MKVLVGIGAVLLFLALFIVLVIIGTVPTAALVWLIWNVLNLHTLFDASELTFWQIVGVAIGINIVRSILSPPHVSVSSD